MSLAAQLVLCLTPGRANSAQLDDSKTQVLAACAQQASLATARDFLHALVAHRDLQLSFMVWRSAESVPLAPEPVLMVARVLSAVQVATPPTHCGQLAATVNLGPTLTFLACESAESVPLVPGPVLMGARVLSAVQVATRLTHYGNLAATVNLGPTLASVVTNDAQHAQQAKPATELEQPCVCHVSNTRFRLLWCRKLWCNASNALDCSTRMATTAWSVFPVAQGSMVPGTSNAAFMVVNYAHQLHYVRTDTFSHLRCNMYLLTP
jgi:hypothetical protein